MATDPSEFVSIFSPGGTRLTLPPASPAGSEAGGVGSAQSSQTPAQQGAGGSVVQKILGGPSGSIGSVGGGSDTAGSKTGATEPVTPAPVSPARIGDGPGEQRAGAQSPPVMMSPENDAQDHSGSVFVFGRVYYLKSTFNSVSCKSFLL